VNKALFLEQLLKYSDLLYRLDLLANRGDIAQDSGPEICMNFRHILMHETCACIWTRL